MSAHPPVPGPPADGPSGRLERLSIGDLMTFWAESPGSPMHIALAAVVEGPIEVATVVEELRVRTARLPDFSRHVRWTHVGEGPPLLVDDAAYRFDDHVRVLPPADLGDAAAFAELAAARAVEPLDHDRPLWRADLVPGLDPGDVGVVLVMHHAIADGIRGMLLAASLFDPAPGQAAAPPTAHPPLPEPSAPRLVADNAARIVDTVDYLRGLLRQRGDQRRGWADARASIRELRTPAPRTRLDGPSSARRDLAVVRRPLDELRATAHRHGVTINDVLLAAVSGGMRELLLAHGQPVGGLSLRVSIPVASPPGARNAGGSMPIVTGLPVDDPDPLVRLAAIHRDLADRKAHRDRTYRGVGQSPLMPRFVMRLLTRVMRTRGNRMVNLYVTNVPGPPDPLWLGAAKVVQPVPIAPLVAGGRISVAALSYAGELAIAVHTDQALRHTDRLVDGLAATLDTLASSPAPDRPVPSAASSS